MPSTPLQVRRLRSNTDFAGIACDFDCAGYTVEKPQDFRRAFEEASAAKRPAVIDCKTEFAGRRRACGKRTEGNR